MTPAQLHQLLTEVQKDYIAMVRELNKHKKLVKPVNPRTLPLVYRMEQAKKDLARIAGMQGEEK